MCATVRRRLTDTGSVRRRQAVDFEVSFQCTDSEIRVFPREENRAGNTEKGGSGLGMDRLSE